MAPVTDAKAHEIRTRIMQLSRPSVTIQDVQVQDADGPDGAAVLVTVVLSGTRSAAEWDADDFRFLRREARTAALAELEGEDVRLVYEAASAADVRSDEPELSGDKQPGDEAE